MKRVRVDERPDDFESDAMASLVQDLDETTPWVGVLEPIPVPQTPGGKAVRLATDVLPMGSFGDGRLRLIDILADGLPKSVYAFPAWFKRDCTTALPIPHFAGNERFNLFFVLCYNGMSPLRAASCVWTTSVDLYRIDGKKVMKLVCAGYDKAALDHHDQVVKDWLSGDMMRTAALQNSFVWQSDKYLAKIPCQGKQVFDLLHGRVVNVGQESFRDYDEALETYYLAEMGVRWQIPSAETVESSFARFICHPDFCKSIDLAFSGRDWGAQLALAGARAAKYIHAVNMTTPIADLRVTLPGYQSVHEVETQRRLRLLAELNDKMTSLIRAVPDAEFLDSISQDDLVAFFETDAPLPVASPHSRREPSSHKIAIQID